MRSSGRIPIARRCLFVLRDLPRPVVSVQSLIAGREALSGSHASGLLVAEGLARRGREVGLHVVHGQEVTETSFLSFASLESAATWVGDGSTVWISYGDESILASLRAAGLKPTIWTHLPLTRPNREALEKGDTERIITVSDSVRTPLLHINHHARIGRIYNPLNPSFEVPSSAPDSDRFAKRTVVYAGAPGLTKGLHRVLEMWAFVRRQDSGARLLLAGTGKLYGGARPLGQLGIASPEFESQYLRPLAGEFGSLSAAGIEPLGLLSPLELREVYARSSLGIVNMNWHEYTETFCCAAVEMLSVGLPVFSVSRAALPETIGRSGGAFLTRREKLVGAAAEFLKLLSDSKRLAAMGDEGRRFVRDEYSWNRVVDRWERVLDHRGGVEGLSGPWRGPRTARYIIEYSVGRLNAGRFVDLLAAAARAIRQRTSR